MDIVRITKYVAIGLVLGPFVLISGVLLFWLGRNPTEYVTLTDEDLDDLWDDDGVDVDER